MKNTAKLKEVKKPNGFSNIAVAMIAGVLTGAALGLLYAPVKGKKLRKKINRFTNYVKTDLLRYKTCCEDTNSELEYGKGNYPGEPMIH
ncbi:MAG: hypothetical protein CVT92_16150 [Bacteroidetes bacterium HGW-Bacteroidetes-1]|jgi:gas vesicle protein|nr:MAG: hypothetical protein CVT92_16150 [Bacteroidetes bacterium HGW-Bacteroidetes-1]